MRSAGFYLLQKGHKFAHEVAEDPSRQRVEGGGEGDAADQEDDVSSSQVCCREDKHHTEGSVTAHVRTDVGGRPVCSLVSPQVHPSPTKTSIPC